MKRCIFPVLFVIFASLSIGGCGRQSDSLTVAGSTSVQPFMEVLAEEFMSRNSGAQLNIQGGGSSAGVKAVLDGTAHLGMASRELKDSELAEGAVPVVIARDGIAVVIHPENPVFNLSYEQVRDIFSGQILSWDSLGGKGQIVVVVREEGSGTRGAFDELVLNETAATKDAVVQGSTGAVRAAVAGNPQAIGYVSLAQLDASVKPVMVNGVEASAAAILNGTYPIARPFNIMTKGKAEGLAKTFIDFILSKDGQRILAEEGLVVQQ